MRRFHLNGQTTDHPLQKKYHVRVQLKRFDLKAETIEFPPNREKELP